MGKCAKCGTQLVAHPKETFFVELADRVPPIVCRMVALELRRGAPFKRTRANSQTVKRIKLGKLVEKSTMSRRNFLRISRLPSWSGVKMGVADSFSRACGVNLLARNPLKYFFDNLYIQGLPYFTKVQRNYFDKFIPK